nr:glutamine-hydrolyzing carbamoyl-phosphate synthase small subunit [Arboricoccus pini]
MDSGEELPPTAALVLSDGTCFLGHGIGTPGLKVGELVFNTAMTGYQEILTDPSYAGQIVTFTFPHIGNTGANAEDLEATTHAALGLVIRADITDPSNWRSLQSLESWLTANGLAGIANVDTRQITSRLRREGSLNAALLVSPEGDLDIEAARKAAAEWPGLAGMDLVPAVTSTQRSRWREGLWHLEGGYALPQEDSGLRIVVIDYGVKRNILRGLANAGCEVTVLPATATHAEIEAVAPDGIVLSNGPGDPAATGNYAVPVIKALLEGDRPIFGICLGHQMLGLAAGARTMKMRAGHHGANHPVQDLLTGKVEITSQNHGFAIADEALPANLEVTHRSLFDGTIQGVRIKGHPIFSVQYHPEASPGPMDSHYLFDRFLELVRRYKSQKEGSL